MGISAQAVSPGPSSNLRESVSALANSLFPFRICLTKKLVNQTPKVRGSLDEETPDPPRSAIRGTRRSARCPTNQVSVPGSSATDAVSGGA
jgi:hypothetical protein